MMTVLLVAVSHCQRREICVDLREIIGRKLRKGSEGAHGMLLFHVETVRSSTAHCQRRYSLQILSLFDGQLVTGKCLPHNDFLLVFQCNYVSVLQRL